MSKPYKIRAFDKTTAQVIVEYETLAPFAIDLMLKDDGSLPTGDELDAHIRNFLPTWHFERLEKISSGLKESDINAIEALVEPVPVVPLTNEQLESQARIERNNLLAQSDWTQLPDTPLSEAQKTAWSNYRQALRDLPEQPGFPITIAWPDAPAE